MIKHINILLAGLLISFLGALPLGTLNITAFQIAAMQNVPDALWFAIAVVVVELVVVRITLVIAHKIDFSDKFFAYVFPIAALLLMYLAISSFITSGNAQELDAGTTLFPFVKSTFILGILLSILNPMHLPFWMSWNSILFERKTLEKRLSMYAMYITGIGVGSITALFIFIFAGKHIFQNYQQYNYLLAFIMGCLYLGFSFYLLYLLYKNHVKLNIQ
ncbi:LysE family transporter [Arenibacter sp. GZD96]|uniref:LysE family transporter n=1 Tax=Aurantibrevibacter litoralis TaxID=3106030 RepID=UPI002AFE5250|nr:LysE family transporter [Arenibacter sp. GZD-96]MEA1786743.1 LysE family transporter [Arenibacter sp. GZD-96]